MPCVARLATGTYKADINYFREVMHTGEDNETVGIDSLQHDGAPSLFDLQGHRLHGNALHRGLYIDNGCKTIIIR